MHGRSVVLFVNTFLVLVDVVVVVDLVVVVVVVDDVWLRAGAASGGWLGAVGGAVNAQPHAGEARAASTVAATSASGRWQAAWSSERGYLPTEESEGPRLLGNSGRPFISARGGGSGTESRNRLC